jgi:polyribonucleotide nucleotidyltransferase
MGKMWKTTPNVVVSQNGKSIGIAMGTSFQMSIHSRPAWEHSKQFVRPVNEHKRREIGHRAYARRLASTFLRNSSNHQNISEYTIKA